MTSNTSSYSGREMVVGTLRGYRQLLKVGGELHSIIADYVWDTDGWNKAHCATNLGFFHLPNFGKNMNDHAVPDNNCRCGFYGLYKPEDLFTSGDVYWAHFREQFLAVVEASGKVVMGQRGFRAERMRIVDLILVAEDIRPWPFSMLLRYRESKLKRFLTKYPPDDVSELLQ